MIIKGENYPIIRDQDCKVVIHHAYCPKCNTELQCGDVVLTCFPVKYPHYCPECGSKYILPASYPCEDYVPIVE